MKWASRSSRHRHIYPTKQRLRAASSTLRMTATGRKGTTPLNQVRMAGSSKSCRLHTDQGTTCIGSEAAVLAVSASGPLRQPPRHSDHRSRDECFTTLLSHLRVPGRFPMTSPLSIRDPDQDISNKLNLVPLAGLEPARISPLDFESSASTISPQGHYALR